MQQNDDTKGTTQDINAIYRITYKNITEKTHSKIIWFY